MGLNDVLVEVIPDLSNENAPEAKQLSRAYSNRTISL